jgi:N-formylglutamate amidohydrolase
MRLFDLLQEKQRAVALTETVKATEDDHPLLYTIPHAGTEAPNPLVNQWNLGEKALRDTDMHTEKLYTFPRGSTVSTDLNRYVVNMNRPLPEGTPVEVYEDEDAIRTFLKGMEKSWEEPIPQHWKQRLLQAYHEYHEAIQYFLHRSRSVHGYVFLVTCHSMNAEADTNTPDIGSRPDISLCTDHGTSTTEGVVRAMQSVCEDSYLHAQINTPYAGGFTTETYAEPDQDIHGIQIEVNKSTYMDESSFSYHPEKARRVRSVMKNAVQEGLNVLQKQYHG